MKEFLAGLAVIFVLPPVKPQLLDFRQNDYECNGTGLQCTNCRTLVWCQEDEKGSLIPLPAGACPLTDICKQGRCVETIQSECSPVYDFAFPCTTIGMFPDPADCRVYHICAPRNDSQPELLKASKIRCTDDSLYVYSYNSGSTFCDTVLQKGVCGGYPIPMCQTLGEVYPLVGNPSLYYTCAIHQQDRNVLYPFQQTCPNGKIYYPSKDRCL